jgi:hypothetical protein
MVVLSGLIKVDFNAVLSKMEIVLAIPRVSLCDLIQFGPPRHIPGLSRKARLPNKIPGWRYCLTPLSENTGSSIQRLCWLRYLGVKTSPYPVDRHLSRREPERP